MNFGAIAYLNNGNIVIPDYLLKPFNIDNSTYLTLLTYSKPRLEDVEEIEKKEAYSKLPIKHDIIISPIAFDIWPYLVRIKIYLKEEKGAVAALTNYFHVKGLNILTTDCHRAGFRYMIFSCFLECHEIRTSSKLKDYLNDSTILKSNSRKKIKRENIGNQFNTEWQSNFTSIKKIVESLKEDLSNKEKPSELSKIQNFIFYPTQQEHSEGMKNVIEKSASLPFHYKMLVDERIKNYAPKSEEKVINIIDSDYCQNKRPIKVRVPHFTRYENGRLAIPESLIAEYRDKLGVDLMSPEYSATFGFVNVDSNSPRLRVSFIKKPSLRRYRKIIIDYRRDSDKTSSSMGMIAIVSKTLSCNFGLNLGNIVNRIWQNKRKSETGKIEIIVEQINEDSIDWTKVANSIKDQIRMANLGFNYAETFVQCTSINPYKFFVSLKTTDEKFVANTKALLYKAGVDFGIDPFDFEFVWTHTTPVTESVLSSLRNSNALIQIYHSTSNLSQDMTWLDGEFLAMRVLEKPCARVCTSQNYFNDNFSKFDRDVMPKLINYEHGDEEIISKFRELLSELINKLGGNQPGIFGL